MRFATLVKTVVGLVVLIVAVAFVALLVIDPNEYKDEIIAAVEDRTGREFDIESDIDLKIGLTPAFAVGGVRLGNTAWGSRPDMLKVGEFAAEVALIPLIFGNLQINRLVLRDAEILIESDAAGRSNLEFASTQTSKASSDTGARLPEINNVLVENAVFTLLDVTQAKTTSWKIERLTATAERLTAPLSINLAGTATLDGQAVDIRAEGRIGAPKLLLDGGRPYPVDLMLAGLGFTANVEGTLADPVHARGLDLRLEISGADLQGLAPVTGDRLPAAGPIVLAATVKGDTDNAVLENIALKIGQSDLAGSASLDRSGNRPRLVASLSAERIDLTELFASKEKGSNAAATEPVSAADAAQSSGGHKVFASDPLPLDLLQMFDAKLDFAVANLIIDGALFADSNANLVLDNGALAIKPVNSFLADSLVTGRIGVDTRSQPASISLELESAKLDIGATLRAFAGLENLRGSGAADISLRGAGNSVAEIMAGLSGHTRMLMDQGEMRNEFLGTISGLTQTLGEAFGKKEWIVVECIASDFEIVNGTAKSRINVINTELLLISAEGTVDLAREIPSLKITPQPKGIDLSFAVPVRLGGSLARPTFTPDPVGTGKKISGLVGAVVFPPAAIIGLVDMGSQDNPCLQTASAEGAPQQQEGATSTPAEPGSGAVKDLLDRAGERLQKLFDD